MAELILHYLKAQPDTVANAMLEVESEKDGARTPIAGAFLRDKESSSWVTTLHEAVGSTPIAEAVTLWHEKLTCTPDVHLEVIASLKRAAASIGPVCSVGTMFIGSDIVMPTLNALSAFWSHTFNIELKFESKFCVESHPGKQEFLQKHAGAKLIFGDCAEISSGVSALNVVDNQMHVVPWVHWLWAGFPCTSVSKANNKRSQSKGCVEQETDATGQGLKNVLDFVAKTWPELIGLECAPDLATGTPGETQADVVTTRLNSMGYWGTFFVFDAYDYGSMAMRERCYWFGCKSRIGDLKHI